mgnify:CR=1 FL=1
MTTSSPFSSLPTPSGVPVKIRSPVCKGTSPANSHMISSGFQIISLQDPICLTFPFTAKVKLKSEKSVPSPIGMISETGALPAKHLLLNQGFPSFFAFVCKSRLVRSTPIPNPKIEVFSRRRRRCVSESLRYFHGAEGAVFS